MSALEEIQEFVRLQKSLLELLGAGRGNVPLSLYVGTLPPIGSVQLGTETWTYVRHGGGVSFKDSSGRVIDAHRMIDEPEAFDAWRLRTYVGSLGSRGVKLVRKTIGERSLSLDKGVDKVLASMVERGEVLRDSGCYRLPG